MSAWTENAECRNHPELSWFPVARVGRGGQTAEYRQAIAAAIAVCDSCPVKAECAEAGQNELGIWGGVLNVGQVSAVRQVAPCGTPAAYTRHKRRGEDPCVPCRLAFNQHRADRETTNRAASAARVRLMMGRTG